MKTFGVFALVGFAALLAAAVMFYEEDRLNRPSVLERAP